MEKNYNIRSIRSVYIAFFLIIMTVNLSKFIESAGSLNIENFKYVNILTIFGAIFTNYIVSAGLLRNRGGSTDDYFKNISKLNLKTLVINILFFGIPATVVVLNLTKIMNLVNGKELITTLFYIGAIIIFIFRILTDYTNFVLSDKRNLDKGLFETIHYILKIGLRLFKNTLKTYFTKILIPIFTILFFVFMDLKYRFSPEGFILFIIMVTFLFLGIIFLFYQV